MQVHCIACVRHPGDGAELGGRCDLREMRRAAPGDITRDQIRGDQGEIRARSGRDQGEIRGRSISPGSSATAASQRCLVVESGESSTLGRSEAS